MPPSMVIYEQPTAGAKYKIKRKRLLYLFSKQSLTFLGRFGNIDYCSPLRARAWISARGDAAHVPQVNRRPSFSTSHEDKAEKRKKKKEKNFSKRRNY